MHIIIQELENLGIIERCSEIERENRLDIKSKKDEMTVRIVDNLLNKYKLSVDEAAKLFELSRYADVCPAKKVSAETQTMIMLKLTNEKKNKNVCHYAVLPRNTYQ